MSAGSDRSRLSWTVSGPVADLLAVQAPSPRVRLARALDQAGVELEHFARCCAELVRQTPEIASHRPELEGVQLWSALLVNVHWCGDEPDCPHFWPVVETVALSLASS